MTHWSEKLSLYQTNIRLVQIMNMVARMERTIEDFKRDDDELSVEEDPRIIWERKIVAVRRARLSLERVRSELIMYGLRESGLSSELERIRIVIDILERAAVQFDLQ